MQLTQYELVLLIEAGHEKYLRERTFQAQMVANLMNVSGKRLQKPLTGAELLGLDRKAKVASRGRDAGEVSDEEKATAVERMLAKSKRAKERKAKGRKK